MKSKQHKQDTRDNKAAQPQTVKGKRQRIRAKLEQAKQAKDYLRQTNQKPAATGVSFAGGNAGTQQLKAYDGQFQQLEKMMRSTEYVKERHALYARLQTSFSVVLDPIVRKLGIGNLASRYGSVSEFYQEALVLFQPVGKELLGLEYLFTLSLEEESRIPIQYPLCEKLEFAPAYVADPAIHALPADCSLISTAGKAFFHALLHQYIRTAVDRWLLNGEFVTQKLGASSPALLEVWLMNMQTEYFPSLSASAYFHRQAVVEFALLVSNWLRNRCWGTH